MPRAIYFCIFFFLLSRSSFAEARIGSALFVDAISPPDISSGDPIQLPPEAIFGMADQLSESLDKTLDLWSQFRVDSIIKNDSLTLDKIIGDTFLSNYEIFKLGKVFQASLQSEMADENLVSFPFPFIVVN